MKSLTGWAGRVPWPSWVAGGICGMAVAALLWMPLWMNAWQAHSDWQAAQALVEGHAPAPELPPEALAPGPLPNLDEAGPWSWQLLEALHASHLQVQAWSPQDVQAGPNGVSGRRIEARLQGRFADWHRFWQHLSQLGPHWSLENWRMQRDVHSDGLRMEGQWRQWIDPVRSETPRARAPWQDPLAWGAAPDGPDPFAAPLRPRSDGHRAAPARPASDVAPRAGRGLLQAKPADPMDWPIEGLSVLAVSQGPHWRAWLGVDAAGDGLAGEGAWVQAGQALARGQWRIHEVGPHGVSVISSTRPAQIRHLNWKGDTSHEHPLTPMPRP